MPLPFEIYATLKTVKYNEAEKLIHRYIERFTNLRIRDNREFFNVQPEVALDIFRDIASTLDDAVIEVYMNGKPIVDGKDALEESTVDEHKAPRPRFTFSMVNIPVGAELVFVPTGIKVRVASDNQIEYEGRLYKLSPFTGTFMPAEKRNTSGAYQGAKYFTYKGRALDDIRSEMESKQ